MPPPGYFSLLLLQHSLHLDLERGQMLHSHNWLTKPEWESHLSVDTRAVSLGALPCQSAAPDTSF